MRVLIQDYPPRIGGGRGPPLPSTLLVFAYLCTHLRPPNAKHNTHTHKHTKAHKLQDLALLQFQLGNYYIAIMGFLCVLFLIQTELYNDIKSKIKKKITRVTTQPSNPCLWVSIYPLFRYHMSKKRVDTFIITTTTTRIRCNKAYLLKK
jgi:hypothetical protein